MTTTKAKTFRKTNPFDSYLCGRITKNELVKFAKLKKELFGPYKLAIVYDEDKDKWNEYNSIFNKIYL